MSKRVASATMLVLGVALSCVGGVAHAQSRLLRQGPQPDMALDAATRAGTIEALAARIDRAYVDGAVARRIAEALRARERAGGYAMIHSASAFAETLTAELRRESHDLHMAVFYSHDPLPPGRGATLPSPEIAAEEQRYAATHNFGIEGVRRLPGNVGYLEVREFLGGNDGKLAAAFRLLADTDALIVDLRRCPGGRPEASHLLASYLLPPQRTLLAVTYVRERDDSLKEWSVTDLAGPRYAGRDVWVLTSRGTFSAGEMLAYNLQAMRRARVVGDTTGGGGHGIDFTQLSEHFAASIPFIRPINPYTGRGWEGIGVRPDLATPAADALRAAHLEALRALLGRAAPGERAALESMIRDLEAGKDAEEPRGGSTRRIVRG